MPRFVNLVQGSDDWLTWRQQGIGCSDIPVIMEESPWLSAFTLWQQKCGFAQPKAQTYAQAHGARSEALAARWYAREKFGNNSKPLAPATAVSDEYECLRASVDGWDGRFHHGVEIKCPTSATVFRRAREGHIPWYYMLQMYGEMEILNAASWDYCVWYEGEGTIIPVERDSELWMRKIVPQLLEFWIRVEGREWPAPEGDATEESAEWVAAAREWRAAHAILAEAEDRKLHAQAVLRRLAEAKNTIGGGVKVSWIYWRPRYKIEIEVDSPEAAERVMAAAEPLYGDDGVVKIGRTDWAANWVLRIGEK